MKRKTMTRVFQKGCLRRQMAAALSAVMLAGLCSMGGGTIANAQEAAVPKDGLIADYSFTQAPADGKTVANKAAGSSIGDAVVQNEGTGKWEDSALVLSGEGKSANPKGTWVSLPNDILKGKESATISIEVKPDASIISQFHFMWVIGNSGTNTYWFAETKTPRSAIKYANSEKNASGSGGLTGNQWYSITATIDAKTHTSTYYVNGVKVGEGKEDSLSLAQVSDQSRNTIGRAPFDDPMFKGAVSTFRVYDRALSAEEVQAISASDAKLHESEIENIAKENVKNVKDVNITESRVTLPDYDGTVTWTSEMPEIDIQDDGVTAIVKQPASGEKALTGKLTATMTVRGAKASKEVAVTVEPEKLPTDPYGYMMVHFVEDSKGYKEKIYLDISRGDNPEQWDRLNGGEPILTSNMSTTGVRDPYLTYNPETKTYYILATDLRVFGGDNLQWGGWSWDYSTKISIWESKDLINWSEQRQFDVATDKDGKKLARLGMMWAPEATWVPDYYGEGKGAFVMYWSSKTYPDAAESGDDAKRYSRIMWGATTDFTQETYEYGGVFIDAGGETIDTTIIQNEGKTYRLTKDNSSTKKGIYLESTDAKEWWKPAAKWTMIQQKVGAQFADGNQSGVEGPAMFKNHNEDKWYAYVDVIPSIGYRPMVTTNLDEGFTALDSPDFYMAPSTKHGGMISLTKEMYDAVRAADATSVVKEELGEVKVSAGTSADQLAKKMPAEAEVNLAYNYGTSKLPVAWDLSSVKLEEAGTYTVTGTVQSIGANLNQWKGKDGSTEWNAADKVKYSSTAITVKADVVVSDKPVEPDKTVDEIFTDINSDSWYKDYVQYVFDRGIMKGMTETYFGSNEILTRSHFATTLYRMEKEPAVTYTDRFADVPDNEFYTNAVMWASSEDVGVISGYEDGNFGPNDIITREQMAVMLNRYAKYKKYNMDGSKPLDEFPDADAVSEFSAKAMEWAVGIELIKGEGDDGMLNPQGGTSRAVCATILQRFLEKF